MTWFKPIIAPVRRSLPSPGQYPTHRQTRLLQSIGGTLAIHLVPWVLKKMQFRTRSSRCLGNEIETTHPVSHSRRSIYQNGGTQHFCLWVMHKSSEKIHNAAPEGSPSWIKRLGFDSSNLEVLYSVARSIPSFHCPEEPRGLYWAPWLEIDPSVKVEYKPEESHA